MSLNAPRAFDDIFSVPSAEWVVSAVLSRGMAGHELPSVGKFRSHPGYFRHVGSLGVT